jgi:hypothetical protein
MQRSTEKTASQNRIDSSITERNGHQHLAVHRFFGDAPHRAR